MNRHSQFLLPRICRGAVMVAVIAIWFHPATMAAQQVLRYTDHEPLGGMRTKFLKEVFFAAVEKETNGRLRISDSWDSAIATGYDALRTIGRGDGADIGIVVPEYSAAELPLHQIFKSFPQGPAGARQVDFFRRVYAEVPAFSAELSRNQVVPLFFATGYPVAFFSTTPMENLAAIQRGKWRTASFWHRDFLQHAGATPVSIPWGAGVFDALKTGTIEGLMVNIDSGYMLKVHEVAPHVLAARDLWLGHVYIVAMNSAAWERLSPEDKTAIQRAAVTAYQTLGTVMDASFAAMVQDLTAAGAHVRLLAAQELGDFVAATRYEEVQAQWVKAEEAKGLENADDVLRQVRALVNDALR